MAVLTRQDLWRHLNIPVQRGQGALQFLPRCIVTLIRFYTRTSRRNISYSNCNSYQKEWRVASGTLRLEYFRRSAAPGGEYK